MVCGCVNDFIIRYFQPLGNHSIFFLIFRQYSCQLSGGIEENMVATVKEHLEPFVYEWVVKYGGNISAEHGIGMVRAEYKFACYVLH